MNIFLDEKGSYFVGKTKNLQEIEKIISQCESKFPLTGIDIEKFEKVKPQIEKLFANEFNCEKFYLATSGLISVINLQDWQENTKSGSIFNKSLVKKLALNYFMANAYTIPSAESFAMMREGKFNPKRIIKRDSSGRYKFITKSDAPCIFVHLLPAVMSQVNARELIALILHEVGHNFYAHNLIASLFIYSQGLITTILQNFIEKSEIFISSITPDFIKRIFNILSNIGNKLLKAYHIFDAFEDFPKIMKAIGEFIKSPFKTFSDPTKALFTIISLSSGGYSNEVFADQFATSYGYGPELSETLLKFRNILPNSQKIEKSDSALKYSADTAYDAINTLISLPFTVFSMLSSMWDVHPGNSSRLLYCRQFIVKEIEKEKDSRIKKEMQESLKKFDIVINRNKFAFFLNTLKIPADAIKHGIDKILDQNDFEGVMKPINNSGNIFLK